MECLDERDGDFTRLSPLFNYFFARNGSTDQQLLEFSDALNSCVAEGISPQQFHDVPMTVQGSEAVPSNDAENGADEFRILGGNDGYRQLPDSNRVEEWKNQINATIPVLFGFWIPDTYNPDALTSTNATLQNPSAQVSNAGHACLCIGYDEGKSAFLIKDSFGSEFGNEGTWWLPFSLASETVGMIEESWVIESISQDS